MIDLNAGGFEVVPAYGRDYKTRQEVITAWNDGRDFKIRATGQYISKREAKLYLDKGASLLFRYDKLQKVFSAVVN